MIRVTVELISANTGEKTELARMDICNTGEPERLGKRHYLARIYRGRSKFLLDHLNVHRSTALREWPSHRFHIWNLVATALSQMGYRDKRNSQVKRETVPV